MNQKSSKKSEKNTPDESQNIELKKLELWSKIIDQISPIINYFKDKLLKHDAPITKSTIWGFVIIIVLVLGSSLTLVILNRLDSSGFTFIIGTLLGFLLSMAKMFIRREND